MRVYALRGEHLELSCEEHGTHYSTVGYIDCDAKEAKHLLDNYPEEVGKEPLNLNFHMYPKTGKAEPEVTEPEVAIETTEVVVETTEESK